jgi:ATP-dependent HslUV protease ATP-binding subunit HslU
MIHDLVEETVARLHDRRLAEVQAKAEQRATDRIVDYVVAQAQAGSLKSATGRTSVRLPSSIRSVQAAATNSEEAKPELDGASRRRIGRLLRTEKLDDAMIEIEIAPDLEAYETYWEYGPGETAEAFHETPPPLPRQRPRSRVVSIRDAKRILTREEANKLIDFDAVVDESLERVEEGGMVFIDELDKVGGHGSESGADVSGEGVQRDLLPIVEGSVVMTRYGPVSTHHLLFVAAGSFTRVKPSDLIPELQGRFPLRVELSPLSKDDLEAILVRPENSLTAQYQALLSTEGVTLEFTSDGVEEMAQIAATCNDRIEDIGARRLATILEQVLEEVSFTAPSLSGTTISVDRAFVRERTASIVANDDLNRFIL